MNDPPRDESIRGRMRHLRSDIDRDMENTAATARDMLDWKHYVKTYPWVCLGAAAALGFLIVPKRPAAMSPDLATLTELARTGQLIVEPAPVTMRGLGGVLLASVANIAVRQAAAYLGQAVGHLLETAGHSWTRPHDSQFTS
jgi:hypothetical protein